MTVPAPSGPGAGPGHGRPRHPGGGEAPLGDRQLEEYACSDHRLIARLAREVLRLRAALAERRARTDRGA